MSATPETAEKKLRVKVAPNDDLWNKNDFQQYYGRPFVLRSLVSTGRFPTVIMLFMKYTLRSGKQAGKEAIFTFNKGNYVEENIRGKFHYAIGGFLFQNQLVSYGTANGFSAQYGTLKLEKGCTNDYIVSTGYSKRRGHYKIILDAKK